LFAPAQTAAGKAPVRKKARATVKPKYRNPGDKKQVWTGRGRKPRWVLDSLEQGKTLEDLLIK
jgi:DNA-binding protein H-NS